MRKRKRWYITFDEARIDVVVLVEKSKIVGFSLNLSINVGDEKFDVIRWDTAHSYLHRHEFWKTTKTIRNKQYEGLPLNLAFREFYGDLKNNWENYVKRWKDAQKNT